VFIVFFIIHATNAYVSVFAAVMANKDNDKEDKTVIKERYNTILLSDIVNSSKHSKQN